MQIELKQSIVREFLNKQLNYTFLEDGWFIQPNQYEDLTITKVEEAAVIDDLVTFAVMAKNGSKRYPINITLRQDTVAAFINSQCMNVRCSSVGTTDSPIPTYYPDQHANIKVSAILGVIAEPKSVQFEVE